MPDPRTPVAPAQEIPPGSSRLVVVEGKEVALFNVDGQFYAVGNRCPHRSGPLVKGRIETALIAEEGRSSPAVRCPIHGWLFDLATGRCLTRAGASTPVFPVTCEEEQICLGLSSP